MFTTIILGLIAAIAEIAGSVLILSKRNWSKKIQEYLIALSAGFILSLVLLELIPESLSLLGKVASLYMIIGFGVIHFFEHTMVGHLHFGEEIHLEVMVSKVASISAFTGLLIHAFFDGLAISAGIEFDFSIGILIFLAILLHKIPEGLTVASIMLAANQSKKNTILASFSIGIATMFGILSILLLKNISNNLVGIAFAFSAGVATYVGASDLIPEINRSKNRIAPVIVFVGMILFYVSKSILEKFTI